MDDHKKKSEEEHEGSDEDEEECPHRYERMEQRRSQARDQRLILQLPDATLGATDTEPKDGKHVSFERVNDEASTSRTSQDKQKLNEAKTLVKDMLEAILPPGEQPLASSEQSPITQQPTQRSEERIQHILQLLDHFTRNLAAIEDHVYSTATRAEPAVSYSRYELSHEKPQPQIEAHDRCSSRSSVELRLTEIFERSSSTIQPIAQLATSTQTPTPALVLDVCSTKSGVSAPPLDLRPPCERTHHTITITTNSSAPHGPATPRQRTLCGRIGHTLADFAAAFCLCMQVNKDCIFCLGFFVAFVVSASFLTAFFYRTLSLSTQTIRLPQDAMIGSTATLRINGGYYYITNQRQARLF